MAAILVHVLMLWHAASPVSETGDGTPAFRASVAIFNDFYRPREPERILAHHVWGVQRYEDARFAIVQATLRYQIEDKAIVEAPFCPAIAASGMIRLCLNDATRAMLLQVPRPTEIEGVRIFPGHFGGFELETHPRVSLIRFNRGVTDAVIYFQLLNEGGYARYRLVGTRWVLHGARFTSIM